MHIPDLGGIGLPEVPVFLVELTFDSFFSPSSILILMQSSVDPLSV
jgi:hypothetical protein